MNTLGTSAQRIPLYDPRYVREDRSRFRRDPVPALALANSVYCPTGVYPTRGWVLVKRSDYDRLDKLATDLELEVGSIVTLKNLCIVQARCVTTGISSDKNAVYLVELTDGRGILYNRWFQYPLVSAYNGASPAYPGQYYSETLNGTVPWTWTTMIGDIWNQMSTFLGTFPGLPTSPSGTPDGFWFTGVSAWESLCTLLSHLGLTVACDLTSSTPFTVVYNGADDPAFTALTAKYAALLEDDLELIDQGAGRLPGSVTVLFHRREQQYGTEETVRRDASQWATPVYYSVTVAAPAQFTGYVGEHFLWSDFDVGFDIDGNPLAADVATASAIASERVTQYYARAYQSGHMSRVYTGALPFATGSLVDGVAWTQDFSAQSRQGWKTSLVRGPQPPWPFLEAK